MHSDVKPAMHTGTAARNAPQAHYQLQRHVLGGQLQRRAELVRTLLRHSARHLMLHALMAAERAELQVWAANV